ncbi:MAG TPA: hypothetical protein VL463_12890 [Kofleriaceae bacterium]|nr:hypothetical protein [Kofleriaceae bacterium]
MNHDALSSLSPAAQKALAAKPMAAKGLVPLARPADMTSVLYQIAATDPALEGTASATAAGLPDAILLGAVGDATIDPRVVDWIALRAGDRAKIFDAIVLGPATADPTIATLAGKGDARQVDLIAQNEQRLLRHPEIIAALYTNAKARMSTVDRVVELAVREHVRVPGLACWDEVARAIGAGAPVATAADDAVFAQAAAGLAELDETPLVTGDAEKFAPELGEDGAAKAEAAPEVDEKKIPISKMSPSQKIRLATLGNAFARAVLIRDPMKMVAVAAIKSPGVTEIEAARYAGNAGLADDVIRHIAARREWTKLYGVKIALIMNPKTPMTESMRLMPFLRDKDLRNVARSRGVPSAVVAQARKLISQRTPGAK